MITVRIGTRGSRLALAQSDWVAQRIREVHPDWKVELVPIRTSGDRFLQQPLTSVGGKGLFVKEIEEALIHGEIDCAVHSAKDLPANLAPGLVIAAIPPREDAGDMLLTVTGVGLSELPTAAELGTSSPRRQALLRWLRPDLRIRALRGNVESRIQRLARGEVDAIILAAAGLRRLGLKTGAAQALDPLVFLPAVGQGALVIETRTDHWCERLRFLHDDAAGCTVTAERAFLAAMGGSCHTALAAKAVVADAQLTLHGLVADPEGRQLIRGLYRGTSERPEEVGKALADQLLSGGAARLLVAAGSSSA